METNRRQLLCGLGGLAVGSAVTGLVAPAFADEAPKVERPAGRFAQVGGEFGWKPHKLDP